MNTVRLSNGIEMPQIGYGVYQVTPEECERCVTEALEVGYRMIDTAQAYQNEEGVGNAVRKSGIDRKDIFLVTKVWISNYGYERAKASIDESLRKLQTDYIDLMLLRYTVLPFDEVARRSGLGSPNNMYLALRREYNMSASERRAFLQKEGDVGRFRL